MNINCRERKRRGNRNKHHQPTSHHIQSSKDRAEQRAELIFFQQRITFFKVFRFVSFWKDDSWGEEDAKAKLLTKDSSLIPIQCIKIRWKQQTEQHSTAEQWVIKSRRTSFLSFSNFFFVGVFSSPFYPILTNSSANSTHSTESLALPARCH